MTHACWKQAHGQYHSAQGTYVIHLHTYANMHTSLQQLQFLAGSLQCICCNTLCLLGLADQVSHIIAKDCRHLIHVALNYWGCVPLTWQCIQAPTPSYKKPNQEPTIKPHSPSAPQTPQLNMHSPSHTRTSRQRP